MQRAGAARADRMLHVDYGLDPRQVSRQRTAIDPAPSGTCFTLGWHRLLALGVPRRLDLPRFLQPELELLRRQALGPAPKPMALQFLDDLAQPFALRPFGEQHRLEHVRIVGEGGSGRHETDGITLCVRFEGAERRSRSARCRRRNEPPRLVHPPPVQPLEERLQLGRAEPHHPILHPGPAELAIFEPLGDEHDTGAIPEDQLHPVRPLRPEHLDDAGERVGVHCLTHQRRQPFGPLAEVDRLRRNRHPDGAGGPDHAPALSAWITGAIAPGVASAPTPTSTPPISNSIPFA